VTLSHPPRWLFDLLLERVEATATPQPEYPTLAGLLRFAYFAKRAQDHIRHMDFSTIQGPMGYVAWRAGLLAAWRKLSPKHPRPAPPPAARPTNGAAAPKPAPAKRLNVVSSTG